MYKLLTMPLILLLSGCVTYYYPETAIEDGVYYAEDDPAYINNAFESYYGYAGAAYYPWRSMDYFYFGYGYPYRYGYVPWYYPSYSYFSPWHYPHNRHGYGRRHGGFCQLYNSCGRNYGNSGRGGHDRYVGTGREFQQLRGGEGEDGNEVPANRRNRSSSGNYGSAPARRYVSTAPSGYSGDQGMVIRNAGEAKVGKSRTHPVKAGLVNTEGVIVTSLSPSTVRTDYRSRRGGSEIRYRSGAKQGLTHSNPVVSPSRYAGGSSNPGSPTTVVIPVQKNTTARSSRQASSRSRRSVSNSSRSHSTSSRSGFTHSRSSSSGGRRSGSNRSVTSQK